MRRLFTTLSILVCSAVYANSSDAAQHHQSNTTTKRKVVNHSSKKVSAPKAKTAKHTTKKTAVTKRKSTKKTQLTRHTTKTSKRSNSSKKAPRSQTHQLANNSSISAAYYAHSNQLQKSKNVVMARLLDQLGKPYHWGGSSPNTGFDCSGLVYYAYKNVVKHPMPRTANEMFNFEHAKRVKKSELEKGDLVFFKLHSANRVADHVGVYLGHGKFIQSPRTGEQIRISYLDNSYWQTHYLGARRLITSQNIE